VGVDGQGLGDVGQVVDEVLARALEGLAEARVLAQRHAHDVEVVRVQVKHHLTHRGGEEEAAIVSDCRLYQASASLRTQHRRAHPLSLYHKIGLNQ
jgi:hypothetical protein